MCVCVIEFCWPRRSYPNTKKLFAVARSGGSPKAFQEPILRTWVTTPANVNIHKAMSSLVRFENKKNIFFHFEKRSSLLWKTLWLFIWKDLTFLLISHCLFLPPNIDATLLRPLIFLGSALFHYSHYSSVTFWIWFCLDLIKVIALAHLAIISTLLQRWRCSCKFGNRRIGSRYLKSSSLIDHGWNNFGWQTFELKITKVEKKLWFCVQSGN
jgi:hypothetical protein